MCVFFPTRWSATHTWPRRSWSTTAILKASRWQLTARWAPLTDPGQLARQLVYYTNNIWKDLKFLKVLYHHTATKWVIFGWMSVQFSICQSVSLIFVVGFDLWLLFLFVFCNLCILFDIYLDIQYLACLVSFCLVPHNSLLCAENLLWKSTYKGIDGWTVFTAAHLYSRAMLVDLALLWDHLSPFNCQQNTKL